MKYPAKQIFQLLLIFSLTLSLIPATNQLVTAKDQTQVDLTLSFNITNSGQDGIELVLSAPTYHIEELQIQGQTFDSLTVPGAVNKSNPGQPQLPVASTLIAVPPQAQVRLEIAHDSPQTIPGNYRLALAPYPANLDEENPTQRWDYSQGTQKRLSEAMQGTAKFPQSPVQIADDAWIQNQRVIRLEYSPFLYDINQGSLIWNPAVRVMIHFDPPSRMMGSPLTMQETKNSNSSFESVLEYSLLNYEEAKDWRTDILPVEALVTPPDTGARYRITIEEDGIYKLTYDDLVDVNPAISNIDPRLLQMTNQGEDVAIHIVGQGDGTFDPNDYIIFYGQRFSGERLAELYKSENQHWQVFERHTTDGSSVLWKPEFNEIMLEKYTYENVYWLFEGSTNGLRMAGVDGNPTGNNNDPVPHFREIARAEESFEWKTTLFTGEDTWFWEIVTKGSIFEYDVNISSPSSDGPFAIIRAEFVSKEYNLSDGDDHRTKLYFNSNSLGQSEGYPWSGRSRYSFEQDVSAATILEGVNSFGIEALATDEILNPTYYFDWFEIEYNRRFIAEDNAIIFTSPKSGVQKYEVGGFTDTSNMWVLDITDTLKPVRVRNSDVSSDQVTISLDHNDLSIAMDAGGKTLTNNQVSHYQPPNWSEMIAGVDYIYITHADILNATETLADYRASAGLSTLVIDINDLYNEFNFGIYHPIAIKNFLSYAFENWETIPTYALLVGDGHWNFHEHNLGKYGSGPQLMPPNLVWADPWQGEVDSANLLATIVGEDLFPDLMIARLPVNNTAELESYIHKLTAYEGSSEHGSWEQNHIFVAEDFDPKAGDFASLADNIIEQYIDPIDYASASRIFQDDYDCTSKGSLQCDAVTEAIVNGINSGALILNFIGHASVDRWSKEFIFTSAQYPDLNNSGKLPVILSMDCLDGYWSGPLTSPGTSMIEEIVRQDITGAIAAFSPTGLGVSTGHDVLHEGFYDSLMNAGIWELGSASMKSKLRLYESGANFDLLHTFTVFGDPALQIRNPFNFNASPVENEIFTRTPGTKATHTITLENTGAEADKYQIEARYVWDTNFTPLTAEVLPGETIQIPIDVTTPLEYGVSDTAFITVTSKGNSWNPFYAQLTTTIPLVYGFDVSPIESNLLLRPAETIDHTFTLTHTGEDSNSYTIAISGNSWPTIQSINSTGNLETGETTQFSVSVQSPNQKDVSDNATLTITPVNGLQSLLIEIPLTTRVPGEYEFVVSPESISYFALADSTITYILTIQNTGLENDRYSLEVIDSSWETILSVSETEDLAFLESTPIEVYVTTPSQENLTDTATVKITSEALDSESKIVTFTTTTFLKKIYLPLVNR